MNVVFFIIESVLILIFAVLLLQQCTVNNYLRKALEQQENDLSELDKKIIWLNSENDKNLQELKKLKDALEKYFVK